MPDLYGFDRETAVVPRPDDPSSYDAELHEGWRIGRGINGGLLLALAGRALAAGWAVARRRMRIRSRSADTTCRRPGPGR